MDALIATTIEALLASGVNIVLALGWLFFVVERYYFSPRKDRNFEQKLSEKEEIARAEIEQFRSDYKAMTDNMQQTMERFTVLLEVIKDRMGRNNGADL